MVVTDGALHGTIGGGHLEFKATEIARDLLSTRGTATLHRFPLGASLGQCCGGVAQLLFERVDGTTPWLDALVSAHAGHIACAIVTPLSGGTAEAPVVVTAQELTGTLGSAERDAAAAALARAMLAGKDASRLVKIGPDAAGECFIDVVRQPEMQVILFGAGHVGRALARTLAGVPCRITWVDTRDDAFPVERPRPVQCVTTDTPEVEVDAAPPGAYFLVMTHSHAMDEALAERILARDDFAYFGLIGSAAKRRQFEKRLAARGIDPARFKRMTCPIGVRGIAGKEPEVIAIAVAAELLQVDGTRAIAADAHRNARSA